MLSVKQRGIMYHFLSLWYDSRAISKHSNQYANMSILRDYLNQMKLIKVLN